MKQTKAKILSNERVGPDRFKIKLKAPSIAKPARSGQFVMVKCSEGTFPFLRRPLSFHKIRGGYFQLLYQVIGKGTKILSERKENETLDIIGPLGNGFSALSKKDVILVAGGIAVAPLLALAEEKFIRNSPQPLIIIGVKTKSHLLCVKEFKKLGFKVEIATEDGSRGHKGLATDLLKELLSAKRYPLNANVYACGPKDMLREVAKITKLKKAQCQVSFEEKMACGTGACLGCAVKTVTGFKMACKDGPIFNAGDIIW